jgi:hypothetical protein
VLRKITLLAMLIVFAFGVAALAGCGGSSKSSGGGGSSSSGGSSSGGSSSGGGVSSNPQIKAAVAQCKQAIDAQPSLKASTKTDLKTICDKAGSGDIKDAQAAAVQVCEKIVADTVPSGAAQDQAKAACKKAAG